MGCGSSKSAELTEIAPNKHHTAGPEPELMRAELVQALREVAQILARQHIRADIVIVGGAVSTILLQSRRSTHDVDIIDELLPKETKTALSKAASTVRRTHPNFPSDWLNNKTIVFVQPSYRQQLAQEAVQQNEIVFQANGLTAYAAPWRYAFVSKVDRLSGMAGAAARTAAELKDASDAAQYLSRVLISEQGSTIDAEEIKQWQLRYGLSTRGNLAGAITAINAAFRQQFGRTPIVTSTSRPRGRSPAPSTRSTRSQKSRRGSRSRSASRSRPSRSKGRSAYGSSLHPESSFQE